MGKNMNYLAIIFTILTLVNTQLPDKIKVHDITQTTINPAEEIIIFPDGIELFTFVTQDKKEVLLHPLKEGNFLVIIFTYDTQEGKIKLITYNIQAVKDDSPEPNPNPNPNPEPENISEYIKSEFIRTINNKVAATKMASVLDSVIDLAKQNRINSTVHFRETVRYNMRLFLSNQCKQINEQFDEKVVVPLLEKLNSEGKLNTIEDYIKTYSQIAEGLKNAAK